MTDDKRPERVVDLTAARASKRKWGVANLAMVTKQVSRSVCTCCVSQGVDVCSSPCEVSRKLSSGPTYRAIKAVAEGEKAPLDFLLDVMRDSKNDIELRVMAARSHRSRPAQRQIPPRRPDQAGAG